MLTVSAELSVVISVVLIHNALRENNGVVRLENFQ